MFTAPHFQNHDEARKYLEALRWAGEPVCAHCGTVGGHYATKKRRRLALPFQGMPQGFLRDD